MMKNSKNTVCIDRSIESVKLILEEVKYSTVLSQEEQSDLLKRMRDGNNNARNRLITSNMRFILSRVLKYLWSGAPLEDLFQAGIVGLTVAIDKFDDSQGVKLLSFAKYYIDNEIQKIVTSHLRITGCVSLSDAAFNDIDCKQTMEDILSSGTQDHADWATQYDYEFQNMKDVVRKVAPCESDAQLWEDYIAMTAEGYGMIDVARKRRITEELAKDKINGVFKSLGMYPEARK